MNKSMVSQDIVERQKEIAETKNDFLKEKALERKTLQNMMSRLRTQTNLIMKQSRQIKNSNKQLEDETYELEKATKTKEQKTAELVRARTDLERAMSDTRRDVEELGQCKKVLENELAEEHGYQEQMRQLVAQLKRSIYEVKQEREKVVRDINQQKKIHANLQRMKEVVASDNEKLHADFKVAFNPGKQGCHQDCTAS